MVKALSDVGRDRPAGTQAMAPGASPSTDTLRVSAISSDPTLLLPWPSQLGPLGGASGCGDRGPCTAPCTSPVLASRSLLAVCGSFTRESTPLGVTRASPGESSRGAPSP